MIRLGVDFGGTKIEAAALGDAGEVLARRRRPNPGGYEPALQTVAALVAEVEGAAGPVDRIGVAMPGSISPRTGKIRNANSTWLNGRAFGEDLQTALARPVRLANDADCLALSESVDGAAAGATTAFAAILGTGCGGGVVAGRRLLAGANGIAGEWGHSPLPWPGAAEWPGPTCWCGKRGCLETWVSGPGLEADYALAAGAALPASQIGVAAAAGDPQAGAALDRYVDRLARALATVCNLIDPEVIVLGGGVSNLSQLYERLPEAIAAYVFSDSFVTPVRPARHGDSSGVRGAAWLWDGPP
jgi:fructokinase